MTPALKAMVEAMATELQRQNRAELERLDGGDENGEGGPVVVGDLYDGVSCYVDGDINLEKVAQAGLAAIKVLPDATLDSAKWKTDLFPAQIDVAVQAAVDAILAGEP